MSFPNFCLIILFFLYFLSIVSSQETVAFSAIKGERNGPYISYQTMLANSSVKFNPLYGVFICTEPGLYLFTYQMLSQQNSDLRVSLRTNRIPVTTSFSGSKTSYNMLTGTTILELQVDDIVYCFIEDGEFYESRQVNRAYTSFSGYKIGSIPGSQGGFFSSIMGRNANLKNIDTDLGEQSTAKKGIVPEIDSKDNIFNLLNTTYPAN